MSCFSGVLSPKSLMGVRSGHSAWRVRRQVEVRGEWPQSPPPSPLCRDGAGRWPLGRPRCLIHPLCRSAWAGLGQGQWQQELLLLMLLAAARRHQSLMPWVSLEYPAAGCRGGSALEPGLLTCGQQPLLLMLAPKVPCTPVLVPRYPALGGCGQEPGLGVATGCPWFRGSTEKVEPM